MNTTDNSSTAVPMPPQGGNSEKQFHVLSNSDKDASKIKSLSNEITQLKKTIQKLTEQLQKSRKANRKMNKLLTKLKKKLNKMKQNLDDGETLVCLSDVILKECLDKLGLSGQGIKSLKALDKYIRQQQQQGGDTLFGNLPKAVKEVGGPACTQVIIDIEKRDRNKTAHFDLPENVEDAIKRIKKCFENNTIVQNRFQHFVGTLTVKLRTEIVDKKNDEVAQDAAWLNNKQMEYNQAWAAMDTFLRTKYQTTIAALL